jgi:hypothetical protein
MAEPSKTDIEGDVTNSLSGVFSGPVTTDDRTQSQSVTVTVQQAVQEGMPPELKNATLHHMILGAIRAIQDLGDRIYYTRRDDEAERKERQGLQDERYEETQHHRESVNAQLDMLTIKTYDTADTVADVANEVKEVSKRVSRLEVLNIVLGAVACLLVGAVVFWLVTR